MSSAEGLLDRGLAVPGILTQGQIAATVGWLAAAQER